MKTTSLPLLLLAAVIFGCGDLEPLSSEEGSAPINEAGHSAKQAPAAVSAVGTIGTFALKAPSECENPCSFSVDSTLDIASVIYEADRWTLGEITDSSTGFGMAYTFNTLGVREIRAIALGYQNETLATATQMIHVRDGAPSVPPADRNVRPDNGARPSPGTRPDVPYFMQYDNRLHPSASCQNTSIAMVLAYLGWSGRPDDITARFGKRRAQSPEGLEEVFNKYVNENGLPRRLQRTTNGTLSGLRAELDRGNPVIIHGFFTSFGHVLVVLGYDENGYYVNDPAGRWSERFKGGYGWSNTGRDLYYGRAAFEAAVATSDGRSPMALWYHSLR